MFYVIIFSLAAVILIVAFFAAMARRRRTMRGEDVSISSGAGHVASATHSPHGAHPDAAARRTRKAKRAQSQHDRRRRH
jgi:hypothetical protein